MVGSVRDSIGDADMFLAPSYYNARAIERVLPSDAKWEEALSGEMYPE